MIVLFKMSSGSISAVVHQILSKSDNILLRLWWFNDFQNGGRSPFWILKICSFCHEAFVVMPFCFLVQNFADELWPKKRFSKWRLPPSWISKLSIFGHVTVFRFNICYSVLNSIKSDDFSLRYGDITIFKISADFVIQPLSTCRCVS